MLSRFLNNSTNLQISIIQESTLTKALHSLFFHLSSTEFFSFNNGVFTINPLIGTDDYTPKSVSELLKFSLAAASDLYQITSFVQKYSRSPLLSVIQESIQKEVLDPFYEKLEKNQHTKLISFTVSTRHLFRELKDATMVVTSSNPVATIFQLANSGSKQMLRISVTLLIFFKELCLNSITESGSSSLNVDGFFLQRDGLKVIVKDLPQFVPSAFAEDVANAAMALMTRSPPMKLDQLGIESGFSGVDQSFQSFSSFELVLPSNIPSFSSPEEEISNFRAAAWNITRTAPKKKEELPVFDSLCDAVKTLLVDPIWPKAKDVQKDLVSFLISEQNLIQVLEQLRCLYLMERGDLHSFYLTGSVDFEKAAALFKQYLEPLQHFDYRFAPPNIIAVVIPARLRRIITTDQLKEYLKHYQWMANIHRLQHLLAKLPLRPKFAIIKHHLNHLLNVVMLFTHSQIDTSFEKLLSQIRKAVNIDQLIEAHSAFVKSLSSNSLIPYAPIAAQLNKIVEIGTELCLNADSLTEEDVDKSEKMVIMSMTILKGLLSAPAKQDPNGPAAVILAILFN